MADNAKNTTTTVIPAMRYNDAPAAIEWLREALSNLGLVFSDMGETRRAIEFDKRHLEIAREIGDRRGESQALGNLGSAFADLGEPRRAIEFFEKGLSIASEIGDRSGEAACTWGLALEYERQDDFEQAAEFMQIRVDYRREIEHPDAEKDAHHLEQVRARLNESKL